MRPCFHRLAMDWPRGGPVKVRIVEFWPVRPVEGVHRFCAAIPLERSVFALQDGSKRSQVLEPQINNLVGIEVIRSSIALKSVVRRLNSNAFRDGRCQITCTRLLNIFTSSTAFGGPD